MKASQSNSGKFRFNPAKAPFRHNPFLTDFLDHETDLKNIF
jgi:hypothetical protein